MSVRTDIVTKKSSVHTARCDLTLDVTAAYVDGILMSALYRLLLPRAPPHSAALRRAPPRSSALRHGTRSLSIPHYWILALLSLKHTK